jgi:hypothetical protein
MAAGTGSLPLDLAAVEAVAHLEAVLTRAPLDLQAARAASEAASEAIYQWRRSMAYGRPWGAREVREAHAIEALADRLDAAAEIVEGWS